MTALSGPTEFVSADTEPRVEINAEMAACKYRFVRSQQGEILYTYDQAYTWARIMRVIRAELLITAAWISLYNYSIGQNNRLTLLQ